MENVNDWFVDRETCRAIHDSGLIVEFRAAEHGLIDGFPINKQAWVSTFPTWEHDIVLSLFPTLMCQGAEAYCVSLNRRN
jgi:hypothetical protein